MQPNEIRAALKSAKITQTTIGKKMKVTPSAVNQVIDCYRPSPRIRAAIAEAIGLPVSEIWPDAKEAA